MGDTGSFLLNNSAANVEEYRFIAGRIAGLRDAIETVKEIDARYEKDED